MSSKDSKKTKNVNFSAKKGAKTFENKKERKLIAYILVVIVSITAISFSNSLNNGFITNWDDKGYIMDNPYIRDFTSASVKPIFTSFYNANYHPLTTITYALELKKFGLDPKPFHINNLLIHILNVLLVFWLIQLITGRYETSAIVALFFGIHPMHVESVSWISERKDVLYTFFYIAALISYIFYLKKKKSPSAGQAGKYIFYTFVLFLLSLLSKSAAVSFPVMLLLFDYYYNRPFDRKNLLEKIPFFILSLGFGIAAILSQRTLGAIQDLTQVFSISDRIFLVSYGLLFYIIKLFVPIHLSAVHAYPFKTGGMLPIEYYAAPLVIGLIIFLIYRSGKYRKELLFGTLFFLISIALVIQAVPVGKALTAERYSYVPYIGLFFIIGRFYTGIIDGTFAMARKIKSIALIVLAGYSLFFCVTTWERNKVWKDGLSLFEDVIQKNSKIDYAYVNRAHAKSDLGDHKAALLDYDKAISVNPHFAESWNNRGNEKYMLGDKKAALEDYNQAIVVDPKYSLGYFNRAIDRAELNDIPGAIADYQSAIQYKPDYPDAYYNLGNLKIKLRDFKGAIEDYRQAVKYRPPFAQAYHNIGVAYYNLTDFPDAITYFSEALKYNPSYVEAYINRAASYLGMKQTDKACEDWKAAMGMGASNVEVYVKQYCK